MALTFSEGLDAFTDLVCAGADAMTKFSGDLLTVCNRYSNIYNLPAQDEHTHESSIVFPHGFGRFVRGSIRLLGPVS